MRTSFGLDVRHRNPIPMRERSKKPSFLSVLKFLWSTQTCRHHHVNKSPPFIHALHLLRRVRAFFREGPVSKMDHKKESSPESQQTNEAVSLFDIDACSPASITLQLLSTRAHDCFNKSSVLAGEILVS